jgi:hypothetical protein
MWARRVREETMGTLIFVCLLGRKSRRAWKWTFRLYNDWSLGRVYCPHCRQQHQMAGIKYWLSEVYLLETEPVEPVKAA